MDVSSNISPLIQQELAPAELMGVRLTAQQQLDYCYGREILLENAKSSDGQVKDAKICLYQDENGVLQNKVNFKEDKLEIPDRILGKTLTDEEKQELLKGHEIKLNTPQGDFYVKVDNDLNKVVVKSDREIKKLPEIGGYKLKEEEQKNLFEGKRLEPKVFKGKEGYFIANVELTPDKKGIHFTGIKSVPEHDAKELMQKLNTPRDEKIEKNIKENINIKNENKVESKKAAAPVLKPIKPITKSSGMDM